MRVIITGGYGFIGSTFTNLFGTAYPSAELIVVDKLTYAANELNVTVPHVSIIQDICDVTAQDLGDFDYIVNFAAESHVDNSIKDGRPFVRTNVEGTFNLLEIARQTSSLKKFIQISTDEVYGDIDKLGSIASNETDVLLPSSYYSSTKASADLLVLSAHHTYKLPYLITRTCNNFGAHQHHEKFLPTIKRSILNSIPIPVYGDGQQMREWIFVEDNAKLILQLMMSGNMGIWNIGSREVWKNIEIIEFIQSILNTEVNIEYVEDRKGHDRRYTLNSNKVYSLFPQQSFTTLSTFLKSWI